MKATNLDSYLTRYGKLLGRQAEKSLCPLHVPGRDPLPDLGLLRRPFDAQAHVIAALAKALGRQKACLFVGEMGTGKTICSMAAIHAHAAGQPYRALVFCPGQLCGKWQREIEQTIPGAQVTQLETWKDVVSLPRRTKPTGPEWYVIARDRAKLGAKWRAAYRERVRRYRSDQGLHAYRLPVCPQCGGAIQDEDGVSIEPAELARKRHTCPCGCPLWQMTGDLWRYEPALYVKRRLKGFFDYLVLDEVHEEKGADTAQANAAGSLAASCRKTLALTGTLIGGYAEHLRPLLFRLCPRSLAREGFTWGASLPFSEMYGRIEKKITEKEGDDSDDNRQSRGTKRTVTKYVRPGIMPPLFGRHLIDKAVFLSLAEVAANLPPLEETLLPVAMLPDQALAYRSLERDLADAVHDMLAASHGKDKRLLGTMLNCLLCYPDHPYGWGTIGYQGEGGFVPVHTPTELSEAAEYPKETALVELCRKEKADGRQTWVFVQYTDKKDLLERLANRLRAAKLKVGILRASVSLAKREEWISKNGPKCDVILSHPKLVETGLDLFDKGGRHNFATLVFYETGYNLFTLRQASRRAWRIGQTKNCKVVYLYYAETMQARAMHLMSQKLAAAKALEGEFSTEGLIALAGEVGSVELALAKSLVERMDQAQGRNWKRV